MPNTPDSKLTVLSAAVESDAMRTLVQAASDSEREQSFDDAGALMLDEAGAAEELLALASEASLSSPISRGSVTTPLPSSSPARSSSDVPPRPSRHVCRNCRTTSTPFWRKAPDGQYDCNACGLYMRTHSAMRPVSLALNRESRRNKQRPESCGNCGARETPMWRKAGEGETVCNACGLYWKMHKHHRTVSKRQAAAASRPGDGEWDASVAGEPSGKRAQITLKYSLDNNLHHHPFHPDGDGPLAVAARPPTINRRRNRRTVSLTLVDDRKIAYMQRAPGKNAILAPKVSNGPHNLSHATSPLLQPTALPMLNSFIQTLASSSDNLSPTLQHPLQPLLTSIVSEKLAQQKRRQLSKSTSPVVDENTPASGNWNTLFLAAQHPYFAMSLNSKLKRQSPSARHPDGGEFVDENGFATSYLEPMAGTQTSLPTFFPQHSRQQLPSLVLSQLLPPINDNVSGSPSFNQSPIYQSHVPLQLPGPYLHNQHQHMHLQSHLPHYPHHHPSQQSLSSYRSPQNHSPLYFTTPLEFESSKQSADSSVLDAHQSSVVSSADSTPAYQHQHQHHVRRQSNLNPPLLEGLKLDKELADLADLQFWPETTGSVDSTSY